MKPGEVSVSVRSPISGTDTTDTSVVIGPTRARTQGREPERCPWVSVVSVAQPPVEQLGRGL